MTFDVVVSSNRVLRVPWCYGFVNLSSRWHFLSPFPFLVPTSTENALRKLPCRDSRRASIVCPPGED
jgi:hypothetical protein